MHLFDPPARSYYATSAAPSAIPAADGARTRAREEYQTFLTLWKDADPDIPIYRAAKAEAAALK